MYCMRKVEKYEYFQEKYISENRDWGEHVSAVSKSDNNASRKYEVAKDSKVKGYVEFKLENEDFFMMSYRQKKRCILRRRKQQS
jgi:hypothetical protein